VYIEERSEAFTGSDDTAEAYYTIGNSNSEFEISYRAGSAPEPLQVSYAGTTFSLDWTKDQDAPFILASLDADISTASIVGFKPAEDWMHANYDRIQCLSLRELAIPGSHDSGMSQLNGGSGGIAEDTRTQTLDFGGQLKAGARFFDLRPVIAGGYWYTGHYSFFATS
jgi:hypothetical protein